MVLMFCAEQLIQRRKRQPSDYELRFLLFPENVDFGHVDFEEELKCAKAGSEPPSSRFNCQRPTRETMYKRSDLFVRRARSKSSRHILRVVKFFEAINPLAGFKDKDDLETYLYEQSNKIEPKDGEIQHVKPKHAPEALKSPGIKPPKGTSSQSFQRSRTVPASAKMAPKSVTSPVLKSPPPFPTQNTPSSSGAEENLFAIVDISPNGHSRYVGDAAGRINQAFEYTSQPFSTGSSSPKSPVLPASTPSGLINRRLPPAPLSANEGTRFNFPPTNSGNVFFPLTQPPVKRRQSEKAPKPTPTLPPNGTFPVKKAPPIPSKSPAFMPKSHISSHYVVEQAEEATQPPVPPRLTEKHLPPPLPSDTLTHLIGSRSPSPRSPTVSLLVPLPPSSTSTQPNSNLYDPSEATVPPRPPKNSTLTRNPSSASGSVVLVQTEEELKAPPRPPKTLRSGSATASPNLDPRLQTEEEMKAPPRPPKTQNRLN